MSPHHGVGAEDPDGSSRTPLRGYWNPPKMLTPSPPHPPAPYGLVTSQRVSRDWVCVPAPVCLLIASYCCSPPCPQPGDSHHRPVAAVLSLPCPGPGTVQGTEAVLSTHLTCEQMSVWRNLRISRWFYLHLDRWRHWASGWAQGCWGEGIPRANCMAPSPLQPGLPGTKRGFCYQDALGGV